ncbi:hypothetical protein [Streptomyces prasinopilosus]|uniref:hypothetical protein n=1 Tax=Streptomyces prasinopilosus TaxID=67344 RepID=UPI0006EBD92D|nr:hypothetical protein [Streptomyces prasinopilosus]
MDLSTARARIHALRPILDNPAEAEARETELDQHLDDLIAAAQAEASEKNKPSFWRDDADDTPESDQPSASANFFEPGHTYAVRVGRPGGRERFRFYCESVTTDPETGRPHALGQHGRLRTADGEWIWTPNPRTYDDWRSGAWTDVTEELA